MRGHLHFERVVFQRANWAYKQSIGFENFLIDMLSTFHFLGYRFAWDEFSNNCTIGVIFAEPAAARKDNRVSLFICHSDFFHKHGPATPKPIITDTKLGDLQMHGHQKWSKYVYRTEDCSRTGSARETAITFDQKLRRYRKL